jgi:endoglucanase
MIAQSRLRDLVIETAKSENVPYQFGFIERGGTDAGKVHLHARGVPSIVICVATRYIHSHAGIIHGDDYASALKLVLALCKRLDAKTVAKLTAR